MPHSKEVLRAILRAQLPTAIEGINKALSGKALEALEPSLRRLGRGGKVPHWFEKLKRKGALPNMDGKTVGSVIERLREMARAPSENEWNRLLASPLDGKIGMSFALQWRYNFCRIFGASSGEDEGE